MYVSSPIQYLFTFSVFPYFRSFAMESAVILDTMQSM